MNIPSVSGDEGAVGFYLKEYLESLGWTVELQSVGEGQNNVIAYLNQQGSNLPLPAAPAADAAAAPDTAAEANVADPNSGNTADIVNSATPASGAPSVDPGAAEQAAKKGI